MKERWKREESHQAIELRLVKSFHKTFSGTPSDWE